jgi:hypothetical protein
MSSFLPFFYQGVAAEGNQHERFWCHMFYLLQDCKFILFFIHRRGAKYAENIGFMFAVERTVNIKDNLPQTQEITYS